MSLPADPRRVYITDDPAEDTPRARKHALVRETKRVIEHVTLLDVHGVADSDLVDLIERTGTLADALETKPRFHGLADLPSPDSALLERMAYEGPIGHLHGGFVAAAFDELLGFAQTASGRAGYTGTLTIKMRRPTPLKEPIRYEARVERVEGRKIFCRGTIHAGDRLCAEAEAVFISVDFAKISALRG